MTGFTVCITVNYKMLNPEIMLILSNLVPTCPPYNALAGGLVRVRPKLNLENYFINSGWLSTLEASRRLSLILSNRVFWRSMVSP